MKQFTAFTKKEFFESAATYRLYILLGVMLIFGMMSPLLAKLTPVILSSLGEAVMEFTMPEPTYIDAFVQFFSNISQMGMLALIIIYSGTMSGELSKGTLVNLLTKGMKRHVAIISKFFTASVLWTAAYALSLGVCMAYTAYFWEIGTLHHALLSLAALWLFGELMIALLIFCGTLFGNIYGSLLGCLGVVIALNIVSIAPKAARFNPITLAGGTLPLLMGASTTGDYIPAFIVCAVFIAALIAGTVVVFNRKSM